MASSTALALQKACLTLFFLLCSSFTEARDIFVGGKTDSWKIPSSQSAESLNQWAQRARFVIGDSLVWKYGSEDSVLQVNRKDYLNCDVSNPIAEYRNGNTRVVLDRSGPFYFISGAEGHCEKGQKMTVVVLSEKHRLMGVPSPLPSSVQFDGPAMAPTSGGSGLRRKEFRISVVVLVWWSFVGMVLL